MIMLAVCVGVVNPDFSSHNISVANQCGSLFSKNIWTKVRKGIVMFVELKHTGTGSGDKTKEATRRRQPNIAPKNKQIVFKK